MYDDFIKWYEENEDFLTHLFNHNSIIFDRLNDVLKVLSFVSQMEKKDINDDLDFIFDVGYAYVFNRVSEIKLYLEKYFNNDIHTFLKFEELINYTMYLDDLKTVFEEKEKYTDIIEEGFEEIASRIEEIVQKRKHFKSDLVDEFNVILLSVVPSNDEFLTTPEVFMRIAEELNI